MVFWTGLSQLKIQVAFPIKCCPNNSALRSFPQKRESRRSKKVLKLRKYWIPASAGMTTNDTALIMLILYFTLCCPRKFILYRSGVYYKISKHSMD